MNRLSFRYLLTATLAALAILPLLYFIHKGGVVPAKKQSSDFNRIRGLLYSSVIDFEDPEIRLGKEYIVNHASASGKYSCRYDSINEYGYSFEINAGRMEAFKQIRTIGFEALLLSDNVLRHPSNIISVEDMHNNSLLWLSHSFDTLIYKWEPQSSVFKIPEDFIKENYRIKLYIWNKGHETFYADDFKIWFSSDTLPPFDKGW